MNAFQRRHPAVLLAYFVMLQALLWLTLHPVIIASALLGAMSYICLIVSWRHALRELAFYSAVTLLVTIMYASFAHNGITPLFFYNDHAVTKEALIRGCMLGLAISSCCLWCQAYMATMQTNHFLFLFTRLHPRLGITSSMCFRFFSYLRELWQQNRRGQQGMHYFETASRFERIGRWLLLALHTLTQAIDAVFWRPTIMYSKGYSKKRTQFKLYTWKWADTLFIVMTCSMVASLLLVVRWPFDYFPIIQPVTLSPAMLGCCFVYGLPALLEGKEVITWHYLQSKI